MGKASHQRVVMAVKRMTRRRLQRQLSRPVMMGTQCRVRRVHTLTPAAHRQLLAQRASRRIRAKPLLSVMGHVVRTPPRSSFPRHRRRHRRRRRHQPLTRRHLPFPRGFASARRLQHRVLRQQQQHQHHCTHQQQRRQHLQKKQQLRRRHHRHHPVCQVGSVLVLQRFILTPRHPCRDRRLGLLQSRPHPALVRRLAPLTSLQRSTLVRAAQTVMPYPCSIPGLLDRASRPSPRRNARPLAHPRDPRRRHRQRGRHTAMVMRPRARRRCLSQSSSRTRTTLTTFILRRLGRMCASTCSARAACAEKKRWGMSGT
jgi:hypothetical protein